MAHIVVSADIVFNVYRMAVENKVGSLSKYTTTPHTATNKLIAGWQWDKTVWPSSQVKEGYSYIPMGWDAATYNIPYTYFQSGYGDHVDLQLVGFQTLPVVNSIPRLIPVLNHGWFYTYEREHYLFSDAYQTQQFRDTISGQQYVDLKYTPKPGTPILVRQYGYDHTRNEYIAATEFTHVLEFDGSSTPQFRLDTSVDPPRVILNGNYRLDIVEDYCGLSDGTNVQVLHTSYSPILRDMPYDLSFTITGVTHSLNIVSGVHGELAYTSNRGFSVLGPMDSLAHAFMSFSYTPAPDVIGQLLYGSGIWLLASPSDGLYSGYSWPVLDYTSATAGIPSMSNQWFQQSGLTATYGTYGQPDPLLSLVVDDHILLANADNAWVCVPTPDKNVDVSLMNMTGITAGSVRSLGKKVGPGGSAKCYLSTDSNFYSTIDWTTWQLESGTPSDWPGPFFLHTLYGYTYPTIRYSTNNGLTWNAAVNNLTSPGAISFSAISTHFANNMFIAGGVVSSINESGIAFLRSTDGRTWDQCTLDGVAGYIAEPATLAVSYIDNTWICVSITKDNVYQVWWSVNGSDWFTGPIIPNLFPSVNISDQVISFHSYGDGRLVLPAPTQWKELGWSKFPSWLLTLQLVPEQPMTYLDFELGRLDNQKIEDIFGHMVAPADAEITASYSTTPVVMYEPARSTDFVRDTRTDINIGRSGLISACIATTTKVSSTVSHSDKDWAFIINPDKIQSWPIT